LIVSTAPIRTAIRISRFLLSNLLDLARGLSSQDFTSENNFVTHPMPDYSLRRSLLTKNFEIDERARGGLREVV
jgi:hypothetical protein